MASNLYTGFHAVEERVRRYGEEKKHTATLCVYYAKPGPRIKKILALAGQFGVQARQVLPSELDSMVSSLPGQAKDHRGIVLEAEGEQERRENNVDFEQWLAACPEDATVVMLDSVTDPHNVGAILRSCDQFGANLLVVPSRRGVSDVQDNDVIARSSAGASAWIPVSVVTNLSRAAELLKEKGFWMYGADAGGERLDKLSFARRTCLVMGSEGNGISRLLREHCDTMVSIPTCGKIDSLNVSVAAGVLLYERYRKQLAN